MDSLLRKARLGLLLVAAGWWPGTVQAQTIYITPTASVDHSGTVRTYISTSNWNLLEAHLDPGGGPWQWANAGNGFPVQANIATLVDTQGIARVYMVDGSSGHMWERHLEPQAGSHWSWFDMGGGFADAPSAVVDSSGAVRVFAVGASRTVYEKMLPYQGNWTDWQSLGGNWNTQFNTFEDIVAATSVVSDHNNIVRLYALGTNQNLYENTTLASWDNWSGWHLVGGGGGGNLGFAPRAVVDYQGTVRVYETGFKNGELFMTEAHLNNTSGATWQWHNLGIEQCCGATPAVVVDHYGTVRIYTQVGSPSPSGGDVVYERSLYQGGTWNPPFSLGGLDPGSQLYGFDTEAGATVDRDGIVRVYEVDTNGHLWEKHLNPGGNWSGWADLGS